MTSVNGWALQLKEAVGQVFLGKPEVVDQILTALLCGGHVLLEDVPGVGKTIAARAVAAAIGGKFSRIQCTPDLLPTDILGVSVFNPGTGEFHFQEGPLNAHIVLVDEINRATPRTQSALLEAMAEGQITVDGVCRPLPKPFLVIATQNPIEQEGTFPLPEAQLDRFFLASSIGYPSRSEELTMLDLHRRTTEPVEDLAAVTSPEELIVMARDVVNIHVEESLKDYILQIVEQTRRDNRLMLGASPRGTLALYKSAQAYAALQGRDYIIPEDIRFLAPSVLWKRIIVDPRYQLKGVQSAQIIQEALNSVAVPVLEDR